MRKRVPGPPRLPGPAAPQLTAGREQTTEDLVEKYTRAQQRGVSRIIGLSDATASMGDLWQATRGQIRELVRRAAELGTVELRWVAYRDYSEGSRMLESSGWHREAQPLLAFLDQIEPYGGGDIPEAVERALEVAANDEQATRVVLIGDAPPHAKRDWRAQANNLAQLGRPVYAFVVGGDRFARRYFAQIAEITGGRCAELSDLAALIDLVALTAADDVGGPGKVKEYLDRNAKQLTAGGKRFAQQLLGDGKP